MSFIYGISEYIVLTSMYIYISGFKHVMAYDRIRIVIASAINNIMMISVIAVEFIIFSQISNPVRYGSTHSRFFVKNLHFGLRNKHIQKFV